MLISYTYISYLEYGDKQRGQWADVYWPIRKYGMNIIDDFCMIEFHVE